MSASAHRVKFSPARLTLIAGNTLREAVRQKLFIVLLLLATGLVAGVEFFREFNFGTSELKFIIDFGFGAQVFFGSALTIAATAQLFFSEIENRTALTLLAKPVWRTEFIFGNLLGVLALVGVFCALTTGLLIGLLWLHEQDIIAAHPELILDHGHLLHYGDILMVGGLQWLKFGVLAAITLLVASYSNSNLFTVVMGVFALLICHLQYLARDAYAHVAVVPLRLLVRALSLIFPNFQLFNLADQIGTGAGVDGMVALRVAGYALIYIVVIGALAVFSFRSREI